GGHWRLTPAPDRLNKPGVGRNGAGNTAAVNYERCRAPKGRTALLGRIGRTCEPPSRRLPPRGLLRRGNRIPSLRSSRSPPAERSTIAGRHGPFGLLATLRLTGAFNSLLALNFRDSTKNLHRV